MSKPEAPKHRHEVVIRIGTNDAEEVGRRLRDIETNIALYGLRNSVSGHYSMEYQESPDVTEESYRIAASAYLEARRKERSGQ